MAALSPSPYGAQSGSSRRFGAGSAEGRDKQADLLQLAFRIATSTH